MSSSSTNKSSVTMTNFEAVVLLFVSFLCLIAIVVFFVRMSTYQPTEDSVKDQISITSTETH